MLMHSSANDDPSLQHVTFAFAEALARRAFMALPALSQVLQLQFPLPQTSAQANAARYSFSMLCPLIRVAATAANHSILEAMRDEKLVHIVDLGSANPDQWLELIYLFSARPGGAPVLHLSVVNGQEDFLTNAGGLLTQEAVRRHVNFVFHPMHADIDRFTPSHVAALGVERGSAVAITCTLLLHRLIANEVTITLLAGAQDKKGKSKKPRSQYQITKADALLHVLHDMAPKLMVLTEQAASHNGASLLDHVRNAFDYYSELFKDVEASGMLRRAPEGVVVEHMLLRAEILDIVAREGASRRERHEIMARWQQRMGEARFEPLELGYQPFMETTLLARQLSGDGKKRMYMVVKNDGYFILCSSLVPIFSVSAWQPSRKAGK